MKFKCRLNQEMVMVEEFWDFEKHIEVVYIASWSFMLQCITKVHRILDILGSSHGLEFDLPHELHC